MSKLPKRHTLPETTDKTEEAEVEPMTLEEYKKDYEVFGGLFDLVARKSLPNGGTLNHTANTLINNIYQLEREKSANSAEIERMKVEITESNYGGEIFRRQISDLRDKQAELLKVVAIDNETIIDLKQKLDTSEVELAEAIILIGEGLEFLQKLQSKITRRKVVAYAKCSDVCCKLA